MVSSILAFAVLTKPTIKCLKIIFWRLRTSHVISHQIRVTDFRSGQVCPLRFLRDILRIFYENPCNFYDNQCNSPGTDEDFVILWDPEDEILPNNDDDNNSSNHDIGSTVPPPNKKQRWRGKDLSATLSCLIVK